MAHSTIIDVDVLEVPTVGIKIAGVTYSIPRSIPTKTALAILNMPKKARALQDQVKEAEAQGKSQAEINELNAAVAEIISEMFTGIFVLFEPHYKELTIDKLQEMLSYQQAWHLIRTLQVELLKTEEEAGSP